MSGHGLTLACSGFRHVVKVGGPSPDPSEDGIPIVHIGRSSTAMWMRVVSSWLCVGIYSWSLIAPVISELPLYLSARDRCEVLMTYSAQCLIDSSCDQVTVAYY